MNRLGLALLAAFGGVLTFISFPALDWFPLAWICQVPLLWAAERGGARRAFWLGLITGAVTNLGGFYWISYVVEEFGHMSPFIAWPVTALNATYQGLVFALYAGLGRRITSRMGASPVLVYPLVFVAVEHLLPFIFPWYLANSQYRFTAIIQMVDLFGVAGLSFLIIAVNAGVARVVLWATGDVIGFPRRAILVPALGLLLALLYGVVRIDQMDRAARRAPKVKVGMVEANVGIWEKEARHLSARDRVRTLYKNLLTHQRLSQALEAAGAELIVWPESSYLPYGPTWVKVDDRFFMAAGDGMEVLSRGPVEPWIRESFSHLRAGLKGEGKGRVVRGIWATRDDNVYLCGDGGMLVRFDALAYRRVEGVPDEDLLGLSGGRDGYPIVVGARGGIYRLSEDGLSTSRRPDGAALRGIAAFDADTWIAVGDGGRILRVNRSGKISAETSPTKARLRSVDPPYAVGDGGRVLRRGKGGRWRALDTGTDARLLAVRSLGDGLAMAVGEGGAVLLLDGDEVQRLSAPTSQTLRAIATFGDVTLIGGDDGLMLRWEEGRWGHERLPIAVDLYALRGLDHHPAHYIPRQTRWIHRSDIPLPRATRYPENVKEYRAVPGADRDTVQRGFGAPVLFGALTRDEQTHKMYNTALFLDRAGRVLGRYDKNHLLLFGEYLPLADSFPVLREWIPEAGRFTAGTHVEVFPYGEGHRIGVMVCYEDILPAFTRKLAGKSPNLLVNVTNDAWFGKTSEPYLHLALSIFRSVENRLFMVRSTNTGVSAFIDPVGRIVRQSDLDKAEVLMERVALLKGGSLYQAAGDWFPLANVGLSAFLLLLSAFGAGATAARGRGSGGGKKGGGKASSGGKAKQAEAKPESKTRSKAKPDAKGKSSATPRKDAGKGGGAKKSGAKGKPDKK